MYGFPDAVLVTAIVNSAVLAVVKSGTGEVVYALMAVVPEAVV